MNVSPTKAARDEEKEPLAGCEPAANSETQRTSVSALAKFRYQAGSGRHQHLMSLAQARFSHKPSQEPSAQSDMFIEARTSSNVV